VCSEEFGMRNLELGMLRRVTGRASVERRPTS
jgi:hypothetical protein